MAASLEGALQVRIQLDLGLLARSIGRNDEALEHYTAAATMARGGGLPSECEVACIGRAALLEEAGRLGDALAALREALALSAVACAGDGLEPVEHARLEAVAKRLLSVERRAASTTPEGPPRRALDETVRLFNLHPLVVGGRRGPYGSMDTHIAGAGTRATSQTLAAPPKTQTLITRAPDRAPGASPFGRE
jgi:hypothetical protein